MRVSIEWLKEYVPITIAPAELAERLTMAGIAVETIEDQAAPYQGMVVAQVLDLQPHPQAPKLLVAQVQTGPNQTKQVITAATNLKPGDLVPLALTGAVLPNGKAITEVDFKGINSQGMFCSGQELGLEKESAGVWVFAEPLAPGTAVAQVLGATDQVLVLELTANRSDCLGMIGVAREVAALLGTKLTLPQVKLAQAGPAIATLARVKINDPDLCPRYAARVATGIKIGPAPDWMQRRLRAAGVRPINNIVDITNYVMLEYNQPLHAFDLERIAEHQIIVRRAKPGEKLITLDEVERSFSPADLLIADPQRGLCVAGVMGGNSSEVTDDTVNLLLEAAYFNPLSIRQTAKRLEMKTEAAYRFERGIDPNGTIAALDRAAALIESLAGATVAQGYCDEYPQPVSARQITVSTGRLNGWLGTSLSSSEIKKYLEQINLQVTARGEELMVTVPSYRSDLSGLADLAEEVARLYGYDRIPATIPASRQAGALTTFQEFQKNCRQVLQGAGLSEIMTYSLYPTTAATKLGLADQPQFNQSIPLLEPLSEDQAVMRTTLFHGLLTTLAFNNNRRQHDLAVYELARVYWPQVGALLPEEPLHLGIALAGRAQESGWNQPRVEVDFYDLKGILEVIFTKLQLPPFELERTKLKLFHPGRSARVVVQGQAIGFLGQVHPEIAANYELDRSPLVMELDLSALAELAGVKLAVQLPPKYPAVERDLALVLSEAVSAASIISKITETAGELLERVELFDVYQGEQVPAGQRSLAFSLSYRSPERTLNDQEVNQLQELLLERLHAEYGAVVRG